MSANSAIVQDLNGLETHLLSRIKGQDHVIPRVCSVLERGQLGLQPTGKPLGSFLFLGPTGVGKTEIDAGIFPLPVR
jgi:ATP-dependent Clp protease ATP-binding subunit ClpA